MKRLPIRPQPHPSEQLLGYLHRVAVANGYAKTAAFWGYVASSQESPEQVIREITGCDNLPNFSAPAPYWFKLPVVDLGLQPSHFNFHQGRYCPYCYTEAGWFRPFWGLNLATTCSKHRCWLQSGYPFSKGKIDEDSSALSVPAAVLELGMLLERHFDSIEHIRLQVLPDCMSNLSLKQTLKLICFWGGFANGDHPKRPGQFAMAYILEVAKCRVVGTAALLEGWPIAFWERLDQMMELAPQKLSLKHVFGRLYNMLYRDLADSEFNFLRQGFELFLQKHWPGELCGRHRRLPEVLTRSHDRISTTRAKREFHISPTNMRRLVCSGELKSTLVHQSGNRTFVTFDLHEMLNSEKPKPYITVHAAARFLGIKNTYLKELIAAGLIHAEYPDYKVGSEFFGLLKEDLHEFVGRFSQFIEPNVEAKTLVSFGHVLSYWRVDPTTFLGLVNACLAGDIATHQKDIKKFADIQFDSAILRKWLENWRIKKGHYLSVPSAARILRLNQQVTYELISKGILHVEKVACNGYSFRAVRLDEIALFKEKYISLYELSQIAKTNSKRLLGILSVKPIMGPTIDGSRKYIYLRTSTLLDETIKLIPYN